MAQWAGKSIHGAAWTFCIVALTIGAGCSIAPATPHHMPYIAPTPPAFLATPRPSYTRTPFAEPTWRASDKTHACLGIAALVTAETEAAAVVVDADAGRWKQALAHAKVVESQGFVAWTEFDAIGTVPPRDARTLSSLVDQAVAYGKTGTSVVLSISAGETDLFLADSLSQIADPIWTDPRTGLASALAC